MKHLQDIKIYILKKKTNKQMKKNKQTKSWSSEQNHHVKIPKAIPMRKQW